MVEIVKGVLDYGDAPEIFVTNLGRVARVSGSLVRVSWCSPQEDNNNTVEHRMRAHVLHDINDLARELQQLQRIIETMRLERTVQRESCQAGMN
jgi:hypothetical protein